MTYFIILPIGVISFNFLRKYNIITTLFFLLMTCLSSATFYLYFDWQSDCHLFILWMMCLLLSISDYYYLLVEPSILYSFTLIAAFLFFQTHKFNWYLLILPIFLLLLFYYLDLFLPDGLGGGDVKLLISLAFFLNTQQLLFLILISSITGILFLLLVNLVKNQPLKQLPFVPFITLSLIIVTLFWQ